MERLIEKTDPKSAIRKNAENAHDWEYNEDAKFFYSLAVTFRDELIDPLARIDREQMPDPVIGFDDARNSNILAYYTLGRNAHGVKDEIIFNTAHYETREGKKEWKYGRWSQAETCLHEQIHLFLEYLTSVDGIKRPAHGKEFTEFCGKLGLHVVPNVGSHYQVADADSPFGRLMKSMGIARPDDVPRAEGEKTDWWRPKKEKGKSTLHKYECPNCGLKVRVGVKEDPELIHKKCGEVLVYKA